MQSPSFVQSRGLFDLGLRRLDADHRRKPIASAREHEPIGNRIAALSTGSSTFVINLVLAYSFQDTNSRGSQGHVMTPSRLGPFRRKRPGRAVRRVQVDFGPAHGLDFAQALAGQQQQLEQIGQG